MDIEKFDSARVNALLLGSRRANELRDEIKRCVGWCFGLRLGKDKEFCVLATHVTAEEEMAVWILVKRYLDKDLTDDRLELHVFEAGTIAPGTNLSSTESLQKYFQKERSVFSNKNPDRMNLRWLRLLRDSLPGLLEGVVKLKPNLLKEFEELIRISTY